MSAILLGSGVGLGLGAAYLSAGMAGHAADYAREQRMAEAAASGYAGSRLELAGDGLRLGLQRYGRLAVTDAPAAPFGFQALALDTGRAAAKATRRAELECLTEAVYYEARGESPRGQFAVAQVVMNRVKHPAFPKSVCAVVFQGAGHRGCQFSFACDGSLGGRREAEAWLRARRVATRVLAGAALADVGSATHFHVAGLSPMWAPQMLRVSQVGMHVFYRFSPHKLRAAPALPGVETAALTKASNEGLPAARLTPAVETAIEASLPTPSPASTPAAPEVAAKPAAAKLAPARPGPATPVPAAAQPPVADSAMLTPPQAERTGG